MSALAPVYLDYNASAPLRPAVRAAMLDALELTGNPSSVHRFGREARRWIEDARERVAALAGADPADIVFTAGGTEANNLALAASGRRRLLVGATEHDSVLTAAGPEAERVPVDAEGRVDPGALAAMLAADDRPALVSVMLANNETGVIQPVEAVAEVARAAGALVHCDAVQAAGRLPLDAGRLGIDYLTLSAHKLGGPAGVGALVVAGDAPLAPLLRGGGQERRRRAGTENLAGIVGFGVAADAAAAEIADQPRLAALRDALERRIRTLAPEARIHGGGAARIANTSCIGMPGVSGETQVMALDLAGVAVSAGAACSSGKVAASHVLQAMGVAAAEAACAIRVSLGWASTDTDVERFVAAWGALYRRTRSRAA